MKLDYNINELQKVADDFFYATGIGIYIIGSDFSDIKVRKTKWNPYCHAIRSTEGGRERCVASDEILLDKCKRSGKPEKHICHGGLVNVAAPIISEGVTVGYVFFFSLRDKAFEDAFHGLADLNIKAEYLEPLYEQVPLYDEARFVSAVNLAVMLTEHVILAGMIKPSSNETLYIAKKYINDNLERPLSVKDISIGANISKSVLYRIFSKHCGCTLSEYVNRKRIERAEKLLRETEMSISEIALKAGFCSDVYFRMVFKKLKGTTPVKYRRTLNEKEI